MRVLRWISENTRWSQLKMGWLLSMRRWGESIEMPSHVQKRAINIPVRMSHLIQVERMKWWRERPKITLLVVVKDDILIKDVIEWRRRNMWLTLISLLMIHNWYQKFWDWGFVFIVVWLVPIFIFRLWFPLGDVGINCLIFFMIPYRGLSNLFYINITADSYVAARFKGQDSIATYRSCSDWCQ